MGGKPVSASRTPIPSFSCCRVLHISPKGSQHELELNTTHKICCRNMYRVQIHPSKGVKRWPLQTSTVVISPSEWNGHLLEMEKILPFYAHTLICQSFHRCSNFLDICWSILFDLGATLVVGQFNSSQRVYYPRNNLHYKTMWTHCKQVKRTLNDHLRPWETGRYTK